MQNDGQELTTPWLELNEVPALPPRKPEEHKGSYGHLFVIAGCLGMAGAAGLTARAALRAGAGLVTVACPRSIQPVVSSFDPAIMVVPLAETARGGISFGPSRRILQSWLSRCDVLAVGPGLGREESIGRLIRWLLNEPTNQPLVLDADGLNAWADCGDGADLTITRPVIATPHPGEFGRLMKLSTQEIQADRRKHAERFARGIPPLILVLKGHQTLVTNGSRTYRNPTGNPGMASAGSGDVLTGVIAAILGQGLDPFPAAIQGVLWHGQAGDQAAERLGQASLTASDLIDLGLPRLPSRN